MSVYFCMMRKMLAMKKSQEKAFWEEKISNAEALKLGGKKLGRLTGKDQRVLVSR